jgi:hypothetical protein
MHEDSFSIFSRATIGRTRIATFTRDFAPFLSSRLPYKSIQKI